MIRYIDIHAHAYRRPVPFVTQFCSEAELLERYDRDDVQMGAILPIVSPEIYFPQTNEEVLEMVEHHPDRFFAFCNIDPRLLTNSVDAPLDRVLAYYKDAGCRGLGEIMPNLSMNDPLLQNLFKHAEKVGLPVTCDGSDRVGGDFGLYDEPGLPYLEHTLQRFPKLNIIGHGPTFWAEISRIERPAMRKTTFTPDGDQVGHCVPKGPIREEGVLQQLLRRYDNLYGELSDGHAQLLRDAEYGPKFLTEFQDKLFYGSDVCSFGHQFSLKKTLTQWFEAGKIPESAYRKIVRENAIKFFNLPISNS